MSGNRGHGVPLVERFWQKVEKVPFETCWLWVGASNGTRYGQISIGKGQVYLAHRVALMLSGEKLIPGLYVMHECDNPPCVNPAHLVQGKPAQNSRDCYRRGRRGRGSAKWGAKLSEDVVAEMRRLGSREGITPKYLAGVHGVSEVTAWKAINGRTWKHVPTTRFKWGKP